PSTKTQRARIRNSITNAKPANKTSLTQIILEYSQHLHACAYLFQVFRYPQL
ncbi:MAG: hypothetical protein ACI9EA_001449, partial [Pseudomonadales bacterium]